MRRGGSFRCLKAAMLPRCYLWPSVWIGWPVADPVISIPSTRRTRWTPCGCSSSASRRTRRRQRKASNSSARSAPRSVRPRLSAEDRNDAHEYVHLLHSPGNARHRGSFTAIRNCSPEEIAGGTPCGATAIAGPVRERQASASMSLGPRGRREGTWRRLPRSLRVK